MERVLTFFIGLMSEGCTLGAKQLRQLGAKIDLENDTLTVGDQTISLAPLQFKGLEVASHTVRQANVTPISIDTADHLYYVSSSSSPTTKGKKLDCMLPWGLMGHYVFALIINRSTGVL
eukprot:Protomagalhaensia_wolfi_Nauph_80__4645@NODE_4808_length_502_cov_14_002160_g3880_i0_p1_GENE_NODE_4808_length_502_cov_14_002160_g3880_i0NODE_4808_length_502_cov_14_002160_g3880_i0_p1_ORF_typecomplete_len119_score13_27EPSP_synthase/PF00275_20/0_15_NODE_4808_length_502_cov_14_002160_g3880_i0139495